MISNNEGPTVDALGRLMNHLERLLRSYEWENQHNSAAAVDKAIDIVKRWSETERKRAERAARRAK